jgi:ketosteroid isomerase-like protein
VTDEPATTELWQRFTGTQATWQPRDVRVQVYGNVAVAAFFNEGAVTYSDGTVDARRRRVTEVWIRQPDGTWKEAHHHDSPIGS